MDYSNFHLCWAQMTICAYVNYIFDIILSIQFHAPVLYIYYIFIDYTS